MIVTLRCIVCGTSEGCFCQDSLVRFFQLLETAENRVSTHISTSRTSPLQGQAHLDKLSGHLLEGLDRDILIRRLDEKNIPHRITRLKDKKWYLQAGDSTNGKSILFLLGHPQNPFISKLITRPSAFANFDHFHRLISDTLPPLALEGFRLTRLDVAVDYPSPLATITEGLDIGFKRAKVTYQDHGNKRTGILVGKGSEKILVYDKSAESGLTEPLTRIELQLSGAKLPAKTIPHLLKTLPHWSPFDAITINHITYKENLLLSDRDQKRLQEIKQLLSREGLFSARKILNEKRNFDRDYKKLISIEPWQHQPNLVFQNQISLFINPKQKGNNNDKLREADRCQSH